MIKPITFLSTIWIIILPISVNGFNFLLSFHEEECINISPKQSWNIPDHEHYSCLSDQAILPLAYGTSSIHCTDLVCVSTPCQHHSPRKVIKESRIAKHDFPTLADYLSDYRVRTIVIDPGHGGHDPGCLGGNSREKHLALGISLRLAKAIRKKYPELNVILTRDKDVFIPLHERAAIANRNKADLFISIHCNFMPGSKATHGSETYVMGLHTADHNLEVAKRENAAILLEDNYEKNYDYDPNSPEGHILLSMFQNAHLEQSILFAEKVENYFEHAQRKSRGVKQAGFVVLKETAMPSVLVETGFLSNADEESFLMDNQGQQLIAQALLSAFGEYKAIVEGRPIPEFVGFPALAKFQSTNNRNKTSTPTPYTATEKGYNTSPPSNISRTEPVQSDEPPSPPGYIDTPPSPKVNKRAHSSGNEEEAPVYHVLTKEGETKKSVNIQFNVQLAAGQKPVDTSADKWHSTGYLIEVVQENNLYKYQARNFSSLQSAFEARLLLQARGFPDAFIVAYRNGKRISLAQARKELGLP